VGKIKKCKDCKQYYPRELVSKRGLCRECSLRRVREACRQLRDKEGDIYERWKERRDEYYKILEKKGEGMSGK